METQLSTELGERFEDIKRYFKLNNSKLAKIAGCSPQAIGDILSGETDNPKIGLVKNIVSELNISYDWLLNGKGQMIRLNAEADGSLRTDEATVEFFRLRIEEKDRMLFDKDRQLLEKDKELARLRSRVGKRKGVFNQASLFPMA